MTDTLITFLASFLIWLMFAGLGYLWIINGKIKKEQALHALLTALIAWGLAQMIKGLFPTVRPFETNGKMPLTVTVPTDAAFPSGHASAAFGLAVSVWLHDKKIGKVFLVSAILVGLGRVMGNVHSLLDISGGCVLGAVTAVTIKKLRLHKLLK
jgi:undecaprenyl-diphosphatase